MAMAIIWWPPVGPTWQLDQSCGLAATTRAARSSPPRWWWWNYFKIFFHFIKIFINFNFYKTVFNTLPSKFLTILKGPTNQFATFIFYGSLFKTQNSNHFPKLYQMVLHFFCSCIFFRFFIFYLFFFPVFFFVTLFFYFVFFKIFEFRQSIFVILVMEERHYNTNSKLGGHCK